MVWFQFSTQVKFKIFWTFSQNVRIRYENEKIVLKQFFIFYFSYYFFKNKKTKTVKLLKPRFFTVETVKSWFRGLAADYYKGYMILLFLK